MSKLPRKTKKEGTVVALPLQEGTELELDWKSSKGVATEPYNSAANVFAIMHQHPKFSGKFGFNVWTLSSDWLEDIELGGALIKAGEVEDSHMVLLQRELAKMPGMGVTYSLANINAGFEAAAKEFRIDPIRGWLEYCGGKWDGKERAKFHLRDMFNAEDTSYTREVSLKSLLVSACRVKFPGCTADSILVLEGPQAVGKSKWLLSLLPQQGLSGPFQWSAELTANDLGSKDAMSGVKGCWLIELPEMKHNDLTSNEQAKSFITRKWDRFRPAYEKRDISVPRRCSLIATTNSDEIFKDQTGNRRYWPVYVPGFDNPRTGAPERNHELMTEEYREQLWGEVWNLLPHELEDGSAPEDLWKLTSLQGLEAIQAQVIETEKRMAENPVDTWVVRYVDGYQSADGPRDFVLMADCKIWVQEQMGERIGQRSITMGLRNAGFRQHQEKEGERRRGWLRLGRSEPKKTYF